MHLNHFYSYQTFTLCFLNSCSFRCHINTRWGGFAALNAAWGLSLFERKQTALVRISINSVHNPFSFSYTRQNILQQSVCCWKIVTFLKFQPFFFSDAALEVVLLYLNQNKYPYLTDVHLWLLYKSSERRSVNACDWHKWVAFVPLKVAAILQTLTSTGLIHQVLEDATWFMVFL